MKEKTKTGREAEMALIKEKCLRCLAVNGKTSALNMLHNMLRVQGEFSEISRGLEKAMAGELDTSLQVREYINSIN